jgi:hypothetical protein
VANRSARHFLVLALAAAVSSLAQGADFEAPRQRGLDVAKLKAREAEKQRLIAKLHAEAPKQIEPAVGVNPLAEPIFHRHDRP